MTTTAEKIAVMQGYCNGKHVQIYASGWHDMSAEPTWDWSHHDYRVKPEPREWEVAVDNNGKIHSCGFGLEYATCVKGYTKVREVLE